MPREFFRGLFVQYAEAHGNTDARQREIDKGRWPGKPMKGYNDWLRRQWGQWEQVAGEALEKSLFNWYLFSKWLREKRHQDEIE
jgi:hypothetical protein